MNNPTCLGSEGLAVGRNQNRGASATSLNKNVKDGTLSYCVDLSRRLVSEDDGRRRRKRDRETRPCQFSPR